MQEDQLQSSESGARHRTQRRLMRRLFQMKTPELSDNMQCNVYRILICELAAHIPQSGAWLMGPPVDCSLFLD